MKVNYVNTFIDLKIKETLNNSGLREGDFWCLVNFIVDNNEMHYEIERESLTKNEIINGTKIIHDYYYDNIYHEELIFIKNYIKIKFYKNEKKLELKLISLVNNKFKEYSLMFKDKEIEEFLNLIKKNNIK